MRHRLVRFTAVVPRSAQEDAGPHVRPRQRLGVLRGELAAEREQAAGVVAMMVAEDDLADAGQVDAELAGVPEHGLGAAPVSNSSRCPSASTIAAKPHSPIPRASASIVESTVTFNVRTCPGARLPGS